MIHVKSPFMYGLRYVSYCINLASVLMIDISSIYWPITIFIDLYFSPLTNITIAITTSSNVTLYIHPFILFKKLL